MTRVSTSLFSLLLILLLSFLSINSIITVHSASSGVQCTVSNTVSTFSALLAAVADPLQSIICLNGGDYTFQGAAISITRSLAIVGIPGQHVRFYANNTNGMLNSNAAAGLNLNIFGIDFYYGGNPVGSYNNRGGAIRIGNYTAALITNCTFTGNFARFGGAIYANLGSTAIISQCHFDANGGSSLVTTVTNTGGAIYGDTGSSIYCTDCIFTNNHVYGTPLQNKGGAVFLANGASGNFTACTFSGNGSPIAGGAIATDPNVRLDLTEVTFSNSTSVTGGAIYALNTTFINIYNASFTTSVSTLEGGVVYLGPGSNITVHEARFTDNVALSGAVLYMPNGTSSSSLPSYVSFFTSNFTGNHLSGLSSPVGGNVIQLGQNHHLVVSKCSFVNNKHGSLPVTMLAGAIDNDVNANTSAHVAIAFTTFTNNQVGSQEYDLRFAGAYALYLFSPNPSTHNSVGFPSTHVIEPNITQFCHDCDIIDPFLCTAVYECAYPVLSTSYTPTSTPGGSPTGTFNPQGATGNSGDPDIWPIVVGVVVGALVLILVIVLLYRRYRGRSKGEGAVEWGRDGSVIAVAVPLSSTRNSQLQLIEKQTTGMEKNLSAQGRYEDFSSAAAKAKAHEAMYGTRPESTYEAVVHGQPQDPSLYVAVTSLQPSYLYPPTEGEPSGDSAYITAEEATDALRARTSSRIPDVTYAKLDHM